MIKHFTHNILVLILFLGTMLSGFSLQAQICKKGTPPGFMQKYSDSILNISPDVDWDAINIEDENYKRMGLPFRAGISVPIGIDINSSGRWTKLPNGKMMWRIILKSQGAYALGVVFDLFELPEGSELYIYDTKKRQFIGALGNHNNNEFRILSTRVLPGDEIVIEYTESPNTTAANSETATSASNYQSEALLRIGELVYTYKDAFVFDSETGAKPETGASESCQVNINCSPVGTDYQQQKRGVAHIFFPIGNDWYFCSGSLVNNTAQDGTPYFLTAWHCGDGSSAVDRAKWEFYFNYEYLNCTNTGIPTTNQVITGCSYKASGPTSIRKCEI